MVIHALNYSAVDGSEQNVVTRDVNVSGERPVNVIDEPRCSADATPGAALAVAGTTRAFEGVLRVELVDGTGTLLVGQTVRAVSAVGEASWSTTLMLPAHLQTGIYQLVAFDYDGRDGARENEFAVPIEVRTPFGLAMVEAMACGTPVIAMNCGSVREVVADGVSGFVCDSLRDFMDAVPKAASLDRAACRTYAEARFSAAAMADSYEDVYRRLVCGRREERTSHDSLSRSDLAASRTRMHLPLPALPGGQVIGSSFVTS
jgi:Glycosyl transferases group 1/Immunoglobulin-like domain of bacterial spore germination